MKRYITAIRNHFRFRRLRAIDRKIAGLEVKAVTYDQVRHRGEFGTNRVPYEDGLMAMECRAKIAELKVERRQIREALARAGVALVAE